MAEPRTSEHDSGDIRDQLRELQDAREQLGASREILLALSRASANPDQVLDTIVERAGWLCGAHVSQLYLVEGQRFRLSRITGAVPGDFLSYINEHPMAVDRGTLVGRVAADRRTQQLDDVLDDPNYGRGDLQRLGGFRSLMSSPMLLGDEVVGVLSMWRLEVDPFDDRERALLEEFAVQGAIALRQMRLMQSLEARGAELTAKVAQLEALAEVGEAVSESLDLDEVLERIVTNAVRLTGTDGGSIMEYDAESESFLVRTAVGHVGDLLDRLRQLSIRRDNTLVGRTAIVRHPLQIADLREQELDPHLKLLHADGWRSLLAVPMFRRQQMVGALVIRRRTPGSFDDETVELLQTFAAQSALAILNARLFRELETQSQELELVSRHKTEFLASMSHELRTPLNAVIGFSEVLLDRLFGELNERQAEYLHDIWNSGRHLLELLNEILDLSKVEAGEMRLEPTRFTVDQAVEYTLSLVRERAAVHGITLSMELTDNVGDVEADELRFRQVVLNLVSNAVKFTPDGGRVGVFVHTEHEALHVVVTDTGVGVPVADRERIFESFQQGGRGVSREEGTGLGLTLSRRIVHLFGGELWMESTVGEGSRFGFWIPLHPVARDEADPGHKPSTVAELPVVLLVDDDRASLELVSAYLSGEAAQVVRARDGVEALDLARRVHPAAIVLDIRLPLLDGWEVLAALKADPVTAGVPVVVATVVDERARGIELGAFAYLLKPIGREDLIDALQRAGVLAAAGTRGGRAR